MKASQALDTLTRIAREKLDWEGPLESRMRLVEDLELDSIRLLTLAMAVENHFRIRLSEEDETEIKTVGDLLAVIERNSRGGA